VTDCQVGAPDRIHGQGLDRTAGRINAGELNAEGKRHLLVVGGDMDKVTDTTKGGADILNSELHEGVVAFAELPDGMLRVGVDQDSQ
jgi:hypothetical protein